MHFYRAILLLLATFLLQSCASGFPKYTSLNDNEVIVSGRILFKEKFYEAGDLKEKAESSLKWFVDGLSAEGYKKLLLRGNISLCFNLEGENRVICQNLDTTHLDPLYIDKMLSDRNFSMRSMYSFKVKPQRITFKEAVFRFGSTTLRYIAKNEVGFDVSGDNKLVFLDTLYLRLRENKNDEEFPLMTGISWYNGNLRENGLEVIKEKSFMPDDIAYKVSPFSLNALQYKIQTTKRVKYRNY